MVGSLEVPGLLTGYLKNESRIIRPPGLSAPKVAGLSGPSDHQRLYFGRGYKYPSPLRVRVAASISKNLRQPPPFQTSNLQELLPQPIKFVETWRIDGGDLDLHLHQAVLHFPLYLLRAHGLGFPLGELRPIVELITCCLVVCDRIRLGAPN